MSSTKPAILTGIIDNIEKVIIGKRHPVELAVMSLICGGHVLIEDVPGVGKTSLASALAKSIDASFKRIQFTPDVLPSDITGFSLYNPSKQDFEYRPGAIMSSIILADEINRTSPKTQASLLEVMEENQVTVDGVTYRVPEPFMVIATQNPVEYLGTFPLPEAQIDRFFMRISIGYPSAAEENKMLERFKGDSPLDVLRPVANAAEIREIQAKVQEVHVDRSLNGYIVEITGKTRTHTDVALGASPRGSLCLYKAAQAWAYYNGRNFVVPDDIKKMAIPVLTHRIMLKQEARLKGVDSDAMLYKILDSVKVPILG